MYRLKVKANKADPTSAEITLDGAPLALASLDIRMRPDQLITGVGVVYVDETKLDEVEGRLETEVAGRRMILVDPDEIEKRAGHRVFAQAFRRILGL